MAVFSYMAGIFHEYYTVALAPYLAPLVGMGAAAALGAAGAGWASLDPGGRRDGDRGLGLRPAQPLPRLPALAEVAGPGRRSGRRARAWSSPGGWGAGLALAVAGLGLVAALAGADGVHAEHA